MKNAIIKEFLAHQETIKSNRNNARTSFRSFSNLQLKLLRNGNKILLCGNGGSAADAQHIAAENYRKI